MSMPRNVTLAAGDAGVIFRADGSIQIIMPTENNADGTVRDTMLDAGMVVWVLEHPEEHERLRQAFAEACWQASATGEA